MSAVKITIFLLIKSLKSATVRDFVLVGENVFTFES